MTTRTSVAPHACPATAATRANVTLQSSRQRQATLISSAGWPGQPRFWSLVSTAATRVGGCFQQIWRASGKPRPVGGPGLQDTDPPTGTCGPRALMRRCRRMLPPTLSTPGAARLLLLLALPAATQAQDYTYTTNNSTITITRYTGTNATVAIPSTITGLPVTSIGSQAFWDSKYTLTSVTIPNSVTNIGSYAFYYCTSLISVTIPSSLTTIGDWAFADCDSLTSVTIPNGVTNIGDYAFIGCTSLTAITVDALNAFYSSRAGVLFNKSQTTLLQYPGGNVGSYAVPNSVTTITDYAFNWCAGLTNVTIPISVTNIGGGPFYACTNLTAITVDALNGFYSSVSGVLFDKHQAKFVQYPGGNLGIYGIPNTVTTIGDYAFATCSGLTNVTIPDSVTSIGSWAFESCYGLTSITIPSSLTTIGDWAFFECTSLTSITIPNSVTSIGTSAFYSCTSLTSITIPNSLTSIGSWAFDSCSGLTNATLGSSVTNIGAGAFIRCTNVTSITIPNSVTSIGRDAFAYCTSLTSVTIPNSVTSIGDWAFAACTSLTSITIPNSVTSIGSSAFNGCSSLVSVYFTGNAPSVGADYFYGVYPTVYYLPGTTGWGTTLGGRPTALWLLPNPLILSRSPSFGVQTNRFGFTISWATNVSVVVEACTNLVNPAWSPVGTNTLTSGWSYFSDSKWTNYPRRFYRLRSAP